VKPLVPLARSTIPMNRLPLLLFLLTILSTTLANGFHYSVALVSILLVHELGHYIVARNYQVEVSLPYFIPFPHLIGTFGAIIRLKGRIPTRNALFDIGVAGPLAGFFVAVIVTLVGLSMSTVAPTSGQEGVLSLGTSFLFDLLSRLVVGNVPSGHGLLLHPVAFAGWVGFLVTMINLFPVGQLDGGHISYAVLGSAQPFLAECTVWGMGILGLLFSSQYLVWALLIALFGTAHPPVITESSEATVVRRIIAVGCLILLVGLIIPGRIL